jgi:Arm DNA-binding domain
MALTDTRIRNAKPKAKAYKLSDGGGMYLLVKPDGACYWRLDYRFAGKRRTLALGVYPTTTLFSARTQRDEAPELLDALRKVEKRGAFRLTG